MDLSRLSARRSELMGFAMIFVILFHAQDLNLRSTFLNDLRLLGFGGVDIFLLLSGLGLSMSLSRRKQEYGEFMTRRAKRLLPAYFIVMLPYTLCLWLVDRAPLSAFIWNSLLNYWVGCPGGFNWYITGIIMLYAVTPPVFRFLRSRRRPLLTLLAVTAACFFASHVLMRDGYWNRLEIYLLNVSFSSEKDFLRRFFDPGPGHYAYFAALFALNILLGWALHRFIALLESRKNLILKPSNNEQIEEKRRF